MPLTRNLETGNGNCPADAAGLFLRACGRRGREKNAIIRKAVCMKWFKGTETLAELKKRYRTLLKCYHPDGLKGSVEVTQEINEEYAFYLKQKGGNACRADGNFGQYKGSPAIWNMVEKIKGYNMTIEVVGDWIWCFHAEPYKGRLRELGFLPCIKKEAWVWHKEPFEGTRKRTYSMSRIRQWYGSVVVRTYNSFGAACHMSVRNHKK